MKEKTITIPIPEGYDDAELVDGKIIFKKKEVLPWRKCAHILTGYFVSPNSCIVQIDEKDKCFSSDKHNQNIFATEKQAKSMLAMAQLSQIIANDERFGGPITEKEWKDQNVCKRIIVRSGNRIGVDCCYLTYYFLAFHTMSQRDLFLEENEDLIKQYYMLDS